MEKLAVVCENSGKPTGEVLSRPEAIQKGAWCMSTNIFVLNHDGQILCHQRSLQKERFPGMWFTHLGGHVGHDETYHGNAVKELEEEIGLEVAAHELIPWRTTRSELTRLWVREFVTIQDISVDALTPQEGEVEQFAWYTLSEILEEIRHDDSKWKAGMYDIWTEYHCMRSVLTALGSMGHLEVPHHFHVWGEK